MNRVLAQCIGWLSLVVGGALIAMVVLVPPWLELHYAQWEKEWMAACARTQQEQVEAYEQFASALASNDPVLLQRLAHHHLRLKPSQWDLVSLPDDELAISFHDSENDRPAPAINTKAPLVEQWLHKAYPVVGIDHPAYEAPDHLAIRLSTGPKRLILLALGGVFLLCGLIMPGPAAPANTSKQDDDDDGDGGDDGEFVEATIDEDVDEDDATPLHRAA